MICHARLFTATALGWVLALGLACASVARAQGDESLGDEYRFTLSPRHALIGDLTGFEELGYYWSP